MGQFYGQTLILVIIQLDLSGGFWPGDFDRGFDMPCQSLPGSDSHPLMPPRVCATRVCALKNKHARISDTYACMSTASTRHSQVTPGKICHHFCYIWTLNLHVVWVHKIQIVHVFAIDRCNTLVIIIINDVWNHLKPLPYYRQHQSFFLNFRYNNIHTGWNHFIAKTRRLLEKNPGKYTGAEGSL